MIKKRKDAQIFIMSHKKEYWVLNNKLFTPIETGSYYNEIPQYDLRDNGNDDNISQLNPFYLETTALYYIWKHLSNGFDYIGVNQHRRQFNFKEDDDFNIIFNKYKIILHINYLINSEATYTNYELYEGCHNIEDLNCVCKIILQLYPEYENAINKMKNVKYLFSNDCFISTKEIFNKYCKFFFSIINEYVKEKKLYTVDDAIKYGTIIANNKREKVVDHNSIIDNHKLNPIYQSRVIGYLQERIFTIFVLHNFNDSEILHMPFRKIDNSNYVIQSLI